MKKNTLLNIATFLCKFINFLLIFIFTGLTIVFIHFQTDRDYYEGWKTKRSEIGKTVQFQKTYGEEVSDPDSVYLTDLKTSSLYFNYLKFTGIILFSFLAIREFQKVLKSVKTLDTFKRTNVQAFRKIGYYSLFIAVISWINFWDFTNYHREGFSVSTDLLIISLLAFIFAEIFREGNQLMEENQLTI